MRGIKTNFIALHGYVTKKEIIINVNLIIKIFYSVDDKGITYSLIMLNNGDSIKVKEPVEYIKSLINCYE